jgi:hypothetical protein
MQPKSQTCIFLGYSLTQNAYKCFEPITKKFFTSRHVLFDEHKYFFRPSSYVSSSSSHTPSESQTWLPLPHVPSMSVLPPSDQTRQHQEGTPAIVTSSSGNLDNLSDHSILHCSQNPTLHPSFSPDLLPDAMPSSSLSPSAPTSSFPPTFPHSPYPIPPAAPEPSQCTHNMTTRSMNQIFKPKQLNTISKYPLPQTIEPTSMGQALSQPHWCATMSHELTALMKHDTWDLILPLFDCQPVGCKWVFRTKHKADGSVDRFKAILVAKGYHQRLGVDYKETFSPVVKPSTIRAVLSIVVMHAWVLRQMNVHNAFLNGALTETVFMQQPPRFKDVSKPHHVCKLNKELYGLKQAPRAWYTALKSTILQLGFHNSKADSSFFIYRDGSNLCYLLVYVDNLVITGNTLSFVQSVIQQLGVLFSLKDLGSLHYFLGIEVIPTPVGLFLSQHQYVHGRLAATSMSGAKNVSTPLSSTQSLKLVDDTAAVDNSDFCRIIGSLQYLILTHPDILFFC